MANYEEELTKVQGEMQVIKTRMDQIDAARQTGEEERQALLQEILRLDGEGRCLRKLISQAKEVEPKKSKEKAA